MNTSTRTGALLGLLAAGTPLPSVHALQDARPNVLVILSDDQGFADIGYSNESVHTPHLDALAAGGARFEQHYAMPQCTPSRVALLTGRYPSRFGGAALQASNEPAFPLGTPTVAGWLRERGYDTFLCGKWHLGSSPDHGPLQFGFDAAYGSLAGAVGMYDHRYREGPFGDTWHRDQVLIEGAENGVHATDLVTAEAVRFIERERETPFFLYLAFHAVHTPLDERGPFVDRPTALDPEDPTRWLDEDEIRWFHDAAGKIQAEPDPEKRLLLAALHHLDSAVGEVVAALDRTGQRAETLILFSSDNGPQVNWGGSAYPDDLRLTDFNQPSPLRGAKLDVWEGGIRVPGFANWPERIGPREVATPVHLVDWFPTLAALAGPPAAGRADAAPVTWDGVTWDGVTWDGATWDGVAWDGVDLAPLLFGDGELPGRDLYWTWSRRTNRWALRSGRWKVVKYGPEPPATAAEWQLFDLAADPAEVRDLSAEFPDRVGDLHARYLAQAARDAAGNGPRQE